MKYKLVAIDVDGTLVDNKKEISLNNINAIKKLINSGIKVTIASGRNLQGLQKFVTYFEDNTLFITYNGCMIINKDTEEKIINFCINKKSLSEVISYIKNKKLHFISWVDDVLYVDERNEQIHKYEKPYNCIAKIANVDYLYDKDVNKILLYGSFEEINGYKNDLQAMNLNVKLEFSTSYYLEIFSDKCSKGIALDYVRKYYGFSKEEVVAIGDNYNDLSMLKEAGLAIAMGNSNDEIKKMCACVTKSNEEDGVAYAIDNFILGGNRNE